MGERDQAILAALWAKRVVDAEGRPRFHPLICHALDVAAVASAMWDDVLAPSARRQASAALGVDSPDAGRWLSFWAGAHDIGKASPVFQRIDAIAADALKSLGLGFPPMAGTPPRHDVITTRVLYDWFRQGGCPQVSGELACRVAQTVGAHHGTYPRTERWADYALGPSALGDVCWVQARATVLDALAAHLGVPSLPAPSAGVVSDNAFFVGLAGLVSVADWIGSNEMYFHLQLGAVDLDDYAAISRESASHALRSLGWNGWSASGGPAAFSQVFGFQPRPVQSEVIRIAAGLRGPALVLIEAPMGEGKTEAALALAEYWTHVSGQRGVYLALPTQATSNQMFARLKDYLTKRYPEDRINLQLLHGHAGLTADFQEIRLSAVDEDDPTGEGGVVAAEWFTHRKRGLLAPFAVGTVDQVLLSVLQTRHYFVRLFGLSHKTIVLDEIHAYDAYMSTLIERLLEWLGSLGASVVLLSATLPKARRDRLLDAFGGSDVTAGVEGVAYPRITVVQQGSATATSVHAAERKEVRLRRLPADALSSELTSALEDGGCAAVICNTVKQAQDCYSALRGDLGPAGTEVTLFHARFPFGRRDDIEREVLSRFGKAGDRPRKAVLVATQVVEQSLDLDFDLIVTEMAPADLVLQRMGRLHRHARADRPHGVATPELWLVEPKLDADGVPSFGDSEFVYDRCILLRSWLRLGRMDVVRVPEDVEILVEDVYSDRSWDGLPQPWADALELSAAALKKSLAADERAAADILVGSPHGQDDVLEQFNQQLEEDSPDVHRTLQAKTRLGDPSVNVVFLFRQADGALALDPSGREVLDLTREPTVDSAKALLRASVSLSHRGVAGYFARQPTPAAWRKSPWLRHHKVAELDEAACLSIKNWVVRLDQELGVVIERAPADRGAG